MQRQQLYAIALLVLLIALCVQTENQQTNILLKDHWGRSVAMTSGRKKGTNIVVKGSNHQQHHCDCHDQHYDMWHQHGWGERRK